MLILERKHGEEIHIGDDIVVVLLESTPKSAKFGIVAPMSIRITRPDAKNKTPRVREE